MSHLVCWMPGCGSRVLAPTSSCPASSSGRRMGITTAASRIFTIEAIRSRRAIQVMDRIAVVPAVAVAVPREAAALLPEAGLPRVRSMREDLHRGVLVPSCTLLSGSHGEVQHDD